MRSFYSTLLSFILLLSNGMISNVVDLCCVDNYFSIFNTSESLISCDTGINPESDCCQKSKKTDQDNHHKCDEKDHQGCDFDNWYYFTPKYFEGKNPNQQVLGFNELEYIQVFEGRSIFQLLHDQKSLYTHQRTSFKYKSISPLVENCCWLI